MRRRALTREENLLRLDERLTERERRLSSRRTEDLVLPEEAPPPSVTTAPAAAADPFPRSPSTFIAALWPAAPMTLPAGCVPALHE